MVTSCRKTRHSARAMHGLYRAPTNTRLRPFLRRSRSIPLCFPEVIGSR